ncbi:hypothetical protein BD626DRAFT_542194 [Schizophyllum amplum]|uniref:CCHC-type domain-containing protein n=1 Tax=Schizophyllum amplum TaxID=97359 RepID=A0A550BST1_9AGAR|nr:hypothetical protein BD626DRAFT_542194 [Auriculariopsis ampla]
MSRATSAQMARVPLPDSPAAASADLEIPEDEYEQMEFPARKRTPEGVRESAEAIARQGALDNAYRSMHVTDSTQPPQLNTLRKRLDVLTRATTLTKDKVVDCGYKIMQDNPRFVLRADYLGLVQETMASTQGVIDLLFQHTRADEDSDERGWTFDPLGSIMAGLTSARSLPSLHLAWGLFNSRCATAVKVYHKYRARVEAKLHDAVTPQMSPCTTPRSVVSELREIQGVDRRLQFLLGAWPNKTDPDSQPPKEQRGRHLDADMENAVQVPAALREAFPDRESEWNPPLVYYDGEERKQRSPSTSYGNPLRLTHPRPKSADPNAGRGVSAEQGWPITETAQLQAAQASISTPAPSARRPQSYQASAGYPPYGQPSQHSYGTTAQEVPPDPYGGPPPGYPPPGGSQGTQQRPPVARAPPPPPRAIGAGGGGGPPGGPGPVVNLNDEGDANRPWYPYGNVVPNIQSTLKLESLPTWNGDRDTVSEYVWRLLAFANQGGYMRQAVGHWAGLRLEAGSPVMRWYMTLSPATTEYMKLDAYNFVDILKQQYLGPQWMKDMATEFQLQSFREPKHKNESPSDFIYHRILHARSLAFAIPDTPEEIKLVLSVAPADWDAKIMPTTLQSTDQLKTRVITFEKSLSLTSSSINQEVRAQVTAILREWGRLAPGRSPRFAGRGASAFDAEAVLDESPMSSPPASADDLSDSTSSGVASDLFAVAYNVVAAKERAYQPPASYPFPKADAYKSKKPPPTPCRACGSKNHWNRDCPHWDQYAAKWRQEGMTVEFEPDTEQAYNAAYAAMTQDFERAAQGPPKGQEIERKTSDEQSEENKPYPVKQSSFAVTVEDVDDEYWYKGEMLPADSPYILESIYETADDSEERTGAAQEVYAVQEPPLAPVPPTDRPPDTIPDVKPYEPPKLRLRPMRPRLLCVREPK